MVCWFSLCWRQKGWGVALRRNTVSLWSSTHETQVTLTQTAIWHVTVRERERNATGDRCVLAHCATPVGNRTPQWQPSASNLRTTCSQAATPSAPHPSPTLSPDTSPLRGSTRCHASLVILLLTYWWLILIVVAVVTVVLFLLFALRLWHLSLLVPFHKLVQQNWPWWKDKTTNSG